jgi:hypothetical protein
VGIFYTEGAEFAEVTENGDAWMVDPRTLGPKKERAVGWLPLLGETGIFPRRRVPHIVAEVNKNRTYHLVI